MLSQLEDKNLHYFIFSNNVFQNKYVEPTGGTGSQVYLPGHVYEGFMTNFQLRQNGHKQKSYHEVMASSQYNFL